MTKWKMTLNLIENADVFPNSLHDIFFTSHQMSLILITLKSWQFTVIAISSVKPFSPVSINFLISIFNSRTRSPPIEVTKTRISFIPSLDMTKEIQFLKSSHLLDIFLHILVVNWNPSWSLYPSLMPKFLFVNIVINDVTIVGSFKLINTHADQYPFIHVEK